MAGGGSADVAGEFVGRATVSGFTAQASGRVFWREGEGEGTEGGDFGPWVVRWSLTEG